MINLGVINMIMLDRTHRRITMSKVPHKHAHNVQLFTISIYINSLLPFHNSLRKIYMH